MKLFNCRRISGWLAG